MDPSRTIDASSERRERVETQLQRLDRLAHLLDDQFKIPFTNKRIGVDPLIGLFPGGGDWVAWIAGAYILWSAARLNAPPRLLVWMSGHLTVDLLGGYLPIAGDLFDAAYKSNRKNVDLLFDYFGYKPGRRASESLPDDLPARTTSPIKIYAIAVGLIVFLTAIAAVPLLLLWWLFGG